MEGPSDDGGVGGGPGRGKGGQRNPNPPPGAGGGGGRPADDAKPPDTSNSRIDVSRSDEYITIDVTVGDKTDKFIDNELANWMIRRRAEGDMSSGRVFLGDLAATLNAYNRDSTRPLVYPYGAHPRDTNQARGWRPYPPFERVSWMRELLPFMGDTRYMEMHGAIDPKKSWRDEDNLKVARILVSQFVYPGAGSYFTRVRGVDREVAVTHFVGMAGVGPDAPYYPKSDPRAGIFGYDRQMSLSDITDGASNTIYAIQTDPGVAGPWLAGGGSTIRGTSGGNDVGQRGGFISPNYKGKAGAYALMADGSIRFITKDVDQKVFEALCTAHGGDSVGDIDGAAPKVNVPPSLPRLSSSPPPAASGDAGGPKPGGKVKKDEDESGGAPAKPPAGDKKPAGDKSSGNAKSGDEDESGKQGKPGEPKKP